MSKSLTKFAKYRAFLPTVILFLLSISGIFTTYFFQHTEDELNNEILVVEHQNLLLNVIKQHHGAAIKGDKYAEEQLEINHRHFIKGIYALSSGGKAEGMKEDFVISEGTHIPQAKQQLKGIEGTWRDYLLLNKQAKLNYKKGAILGLESDFDEVRTEFYDLEDYNNRLLEVFIQAKRDYHNYKVRSFVVMLFLLILTLIAAFRLYLKNVLRPIEAISRVTEYLEKGDLSQKVNFVEKSPMGYLAQSINQIVKNQIDLTNKFELLGNGEFSFNIKQHGAEDQVNTTLEKTRQQLANFYELDLKKAAQGNWVNKGVALFSEILRNNTDDIEKLADILITELVKYIKANQGCLYLIEGQKQQKLVLKSTYAWDRKKFVDGEIAIGEGLVGQAYLEEEMIYLTDVPDNYVHISSGLGQSNPRSILIVPLKYNDVVYGILELASFEIYEQFELELVQKISEGVASAISAVRNNQNTKELLHDSQTLTEQMKMQEDELRHNAEELQATQENINRQLEIIDFEKQKNTAVLETSADAIVTFDENGKVEFFNESAEEIFGMQRLHVIGEDVHKIMPFEINKDGDTFSVKYKREEELIDINVRTEVEVYDNNGEGIDVLMTLSQNKIRHKYFFAVFIQSIAVELF